MNNVPLEDLGKTSIEVTDITTDNRALLTRLKEK